MTLSPVISFCRYPRLGTTSSLPPAALALLRLVISKRGVSLGPPRDLALEYRGSVTYGRFFCGPVSHPNSFHDFIFSRTVVTLYSVASHFLPPNWAAEWAAHHCRPSSQVLRRLIQTFTPGRPTAAMPTEVEKHLLTGSFTSFILPGGTEIKCISRQHNKRTSSCCLGQTR